MSYLMALQSADVGQSLVVLLGMDTASRSQTIVCMITNYLVFFKDPMKAECKG